MFFLTRVLLAIGGILSLVGCASQSTPLRFATTTSTYDSGLISEILNDFEHETGVQVDEIIVGTGQALQLGRDGNVDVLLVHAPVAEREFVADGFGIERIPLMYNDFIIVGPVADPAGVRDAKNAAEAFTNLYRTQTGFASRGDQSGTYQRELEIWAEAGFAPDPLLDWYASLGQGQGAMLTYANETNAYALVDRGTFLARKDALPQLDILFGGATPIDNPDPALRNEYSLIPVVNPRAEPTDVQIFLDWMDKAETRAFITAFGVEAYGQPLFYLFP